MRRWTRRRSSVAGRRRRWRRATYRRSRRAPVDRVGGHASRDTQAHRGPPRRVEATVHSAMPRACAGFPNRRRRPPAAAAAAIRRAGYLIKHGATTHECAEADDEGRLPDAHGTLSSGGTGADRQHEKSIMGVSGSAPARRPTTLRCCRSTPDVRRSWPLRRAHNCFREVTWPIARPSTPGKRLNHQALGSNT